MKDSTFVSTFFTIFLLIHLFFDRASAFAIVDGFGDALPKKVLGIYITLADDTQPGFDSNADWQPFLFEYQQKGANVLFFTFLNPGTMVVPLAFQKLAASRGTDADGAVPADTRIVFAIGGALYSSDPNPWPWLTSQSAAEAMAEEVAQWPTKYGCDGIDLDIEDGAGQAPDAGPNLVHFLHRLRELNPDMVVSQPVYGYPGIPAANDVVNAGWTTDATNKGLVNTVGIMSYEGTQSLTYIKNYAHGTEQWEGFPIEVDVTISDILVGCKGTAGSTTVATLADEAVSQDLRGIMVWYASVGNGFQYEASWDASQDYDSEQAFIDALNTFNGSL